MKSIAFLIIVTLVCKNCNAFHLYNRTSISYLSTSLRLPRQINQYYQNNTIFINSNYTTSTTITTTYTTTTHDENELLRILLTIGFFIIVTALVWWCCYRWNRNEEGCVY